MISHRHRCIFVHLPRTGGTSIERAILGPFRARVLSWVAESSSLRKKGRQSISSDRGDLTLFRVLSATGLARLHRRRYGAKHFKAPQARAFYGEDVWRAYFTFAFVRNTWDRLVSSYHFRRDVLKYEAEQTLSFREWVLRRCESEDEVRRQSQLRALSDEEGHVIVDWIGRFEQLQDGFAFVSRRLGLEPGRLPQVYTSGPRRYVDAYDEQTRDRVGECFHDEIAYFDFTFEPTRTDARSPASPALR